VLGPIELDARGRRLRAALAAVLVADNAPELRLVHEWLDWWSGPDLMVPPRAGTCPHGLCSTGLAIRWYANAGAVKKSRTQLDDEFQKFFA
jgi:hypothetical protein